MHIENLKVFCDLVESESFSKAAKLHSITQSAVSQQLRSIEKHFNILVVDRNQKNFKLTSEGKKLYEASQEILHRYEHLVAELQEMQKIISGSIHISTIYSIGLHELHPYVKQFMQEYPSVNIRIEFRRSNLVYEDILSQSADIGLVAYPVKNRLLETIPFSEDKLIVVCSPEHPLANCVCAEVEDLYEYPIVAFDKDIPTRKATDELFSEHGLDIQPVMEFDNVETVKRAVEINAGIAFIPEKTAEQEINQGQLVKIQIKDEKLTRPLAIIYKKGRVLSPSMKRFVDMLIAKKSEINPQLTLSA
ncbi:MAG: LysR family transcriptional regulator [Verrucomicrobia bacterium CG_4_10_14_3_um_filter_43_23]|nr:MAG: LysR family transcriptional regulator [Verrucomicrobia bacterium CG1_02_43_26]PIP58530.1 MAG: LysR family transcriptional regulator [Verrucomicrobia bacterium CG22_combo_CG10-13_8_21_14_all_43_17]PIX58328.1 MAG: LysR family transcriptional regulator [Verrucomicrobia bacterium CG_4_10_14_3_um_filter_43_23]PIY60855.1 MAG: LysR family transcriptional regulator [Verrucomicrobia bacterium CG_4_10_14_0_8_um_filter_43_34]PJA44345.1 MAG: LysR family transcriptional regulator [Verrucomicrobia ba